jgi:hypothetical protein
MLWLPSDFVGRHRVEVANQQVDAWVNRPQTSGVIELSEQTIIDQLVMRLASRYPAISEATVQGVVHEVYARFDGRPLRDYVPLLVERHARSELDRLRPATG